MIFLKTARLVLRNVEPRDAAVMYDYRNNAICARYQRDQTHDHAGIEALILRRAADTLSVECGAMLAVALRDTDEMIGEIVVMPCEGTISLGYTFSYKYHRQGYAYETLSALIDYLHATYPAWDFVCFTDPRNTPSMNLLRKLGYRDMGYLPTKDSRVFGKWLTAESEAEIAGAVVQDT